MQRTKNQNAYHAPELQVASIKRSKKKCTCGAMAPQTPKLPAGTHRIKIQPRFEKRAGKDVFVPLILLKGVWLQKIGFECEQHVLIREEAGALVIELERD